MKKELRYVSFCIVVTPFLAQAATVDHAWTFTYNPAGLIETANGPRKDVIDTTHYAYNSEGRLAKVTDALGHVTTYDSYDIYGNPGKVIDANGIVSLLTYTPEGWLSSTTRDANGAAVVTTVRYDAVGNILQTKDADGVILNYTFDDASRLTDITDDQGNRIHYTLDAANNRTREETIDAGGTIRHNVSRAFNSLSQLLTVTDALNRTIFSFDPMDGYDTEGHPVHSIDAKGVQRKHGYDALNRWVSTIDDYGGTNPATANATSVASHDNSDNLTGISDPDGLNTVYEHNGLGYLTGIHSPDTGTTTFTLDAAGNRLTRTDARGMTATSTYDALNRIISTHYADTTLDVRYHYDEADAITGCTVSAPIGRLTRIVEQAVTTTYCYDSRGNVIEKRQAQGGITDVVAYTYTPAGRVRTETRPSGSILTYGYDALGRMISLTLAPPGGSTQPVVSRVIYLPFGPIQSYTLGNGQTITRTYDANYRVTDVISPALELHFVRDITGNITGVSEAGRSSETYRYDQLYRLTGVDDPIGQAIEAYTYNKTGDRLSKTGSGLASGIYVYQARTHWLTSIGNTSRTYDPNGNTTSNESAGDVWGYGYNERNRMTEVQRHGVTVGHYVYNSLDQRIVKTAEDVTTRFTYGEDSQLLTEQTESSSRDYLWLGNIPVGVLDDGTRLSLTYLHADALGTPRVATSDIGTTLWRWPYTNNPFGEASPVSTSGYVLNLRFPGQYFDTESGLNYNVHRDYYAATGRYIQSDPLGLTAGPSTYAYVGLRPLATSDPLGLANLTLGGSATFIAGGGGGVAGGIYVSWTPEQGFDAGIYGSVTGGVGVNIGLGLNGGYVPGGSADISGTTVDITGGYGFVSGTVSGAVSRPPYASGSLGVGVGLPAAGALTTTMTGHFGWQDVKGWFSGDKNGAADCSNKPTPYDAAPGTGPTYYGLF